MEWLLRARLREQPLPSRVLTRDEAAAHYENSVARWVAEQSIYHKNNWHSLEAIEKHLTWLTWLSAGLAAAACLLHLRFHEPPIAPWLTLCAAGFPAVAAACHAIATQGEFRRLAERSEAMHRSLEIARERFKQASASGRMSPATLRRECESLAALMIEEVVDWQILYRKPVPPG